jgi:YfiH family protein
MDFSSQQACSGGQDFSVLQREALVSLLGPGAASSMVFPRQVHGNSVWQVTREQAGQCGMVEADAVVTDVKGLPVAIRTADCLPLLLCDVRRGVVAAVHAGWRGTKAQIALRTLEILLRDYHCEFHDIRAVIGPCIRMNNYQVSQDFCNFFPEDVFIMSDGWHFDLAGANTRQLLSAGFFQENITDCGRCTFAEKEFFFSYRRQGDQAGRLLHAIAVR